MEHRMPLLRALRLTITSIGVVALASLALTACMGDDSEDEGPLPVTVQKATCGPGDSPETGLQGQVPASMRTLGGFKGFNCNLQLVSLVPGEGAAWSHAD